MAFQLYRDLTDYLFKYHIVDPKSIYQFVYCSKECLQIGRKYKVLKQEQLLRKKRRTIFENEIIFYEEYCILPNGNKNGTYNKWYEPETKITHQGIVVIPKRI